MTVEGKSATERVDRLLEEALSHGASDVHIEPGPIGYGVRYRIDGNLKRGVTWEDEGAGGVVIRIKLLAGMDIAERRLPQDGAFRTLVSDEAIDVRVSTLPTIYGEKLVLRLLLGAQSLRNIHQLGMDEFNMRRLRRLLELPFGMILATGPTGSGKTTTLYALLQSLCDQTMNVVCLEDPVEYRVPGFHQVEINTRAGLTFATGLRSILRQDPNVIMLGEIRDTETAEIAVRAAMTGHRVFSSLHTGDAVSALVRLLDMGVESYLAASAVSGVIGQRLVRAACQHCQQNVECSVCQGTGYGGRIPIFEILIMDDTLRTLLVSGASVSELGECAVKRGMRTISRSLADRVRDGHVSESEAKRWAVEYVEP